MTGYQHPEILDLRELRRSWQITLRAHAATDALGYRAGEHVVVWVEQAALTGYMEVRLHACFSEKITRTFAYYFPDPVKDVLTALQAAHRIVVAVEHLPSLEILEKVCRVVLNMEAEW